MTTCPGNCRHRIGGVAYQVEVNVTGLAGLLLAKAAAAYGWRKEKDWYDIAFVLLHDDAGGPQAAARQVRGRFGDDLVGSIRTALDDLSANFADPDGQGPAAYASQMVLDHPGLGEAQLRADSVLAVQSFYASLFADETF